VTDSPWPRPDGVTNLTVSGLRVGDAWVTV